MRGVDFVLPDLSRLRHQPRASLGPLDVLLADFPWGGTERFTRARSLRGAAGRDLEISAFTSGGVNARGPVVVDDRPSQEECAALQARLEAMEARTREPARSGQDAVPPGLRAGTLFAAGAGELDEAASPREGTSATADSTRWSLSRGGAGGARPRRTRKDLAAAPPDLGSAACAEQWNGLLRSGAWTQ